MNFVSMWNMRKRRCSSVTLWEADRKGHEVTNLGFNCEKCKDDFHSLGGLKKHLSKVHDVRNLVLEGKSESQGGALEVWWWNGTYNVGWCIIEWFFILSKLSRMWHWPESSSSSPTAYIEGNPSQKRLLFLVFCEEIIINCKENSRSQPERG